VTHEVLPVPEGIGEALAFDPRGASVIVTAQSAVRILREVRPLFFAPFEGAFAAGEATARALRDAGARDVVAPRVPGATGLASLLEGTSASFLWPHGSDADPEPFEGLASRAARWTAPVVYRKSPVDSPDPGRVGDFLDGRYAAVAVSSVSALDVLLAAVRRSGRPLPQVRWGAIGPGTARAFAQRNLPLPVVPPRARLHDLIDALFGVTPEE
jgi:uroporphyrinogen-III synthase